LSKRAKNGGGEGKEIFCLRAVGSPATLLVQSRVKQNTLFFLGEKIRRAQKNKIVKSILLGGER